MAPSPSVLDISSYDSPVILLFSVVLRRKVECECEESGGRSVSEKPTLGTRTAVA